MTQKCKKKTKIKINVETKNKKVAHNVKSVFLSFFLFGRKTDIHTKDYKVVQ